MTSRALLVPVTLVFFLISGCRCAFDAPLESGLILSKTLRIQMATEPVSLDPALAEDGVSLRILVNTMEGLVGYNSEGKIVNRLAKHYSITAGGQKYVFELRPDVRWSDGRRVSVSDFVEGFRRSLSPSTTSKMAGMITAVRGAKNALLGKIGPNQIGVYEGKGNEAGKLIIELEKDFAPAPYFIHALTLSVAYPVRKDVLEKNGGRWPETAPGTGPFVIVRHDSDRKYIFEKNPFYYDNNPAPLSANRFSPERVEILIISDEHTGLNLFEQGKVDLLTKVPFFDLRRLREKKLVRSFPYHATYYLAFNQKKAPFKDTVARQAVSAVIDRRKIVEALEGGEIPATDWIPPGLEGHEPFHSQHASFEWDWVSKISNSLVAQFDSGSRNSLVMEKVQHDLATRLGLRISLQNADWKTHIRQLQVDPAPLYRFAWQAPYDDPLPHLQVFLSDSPNNYTGWKNPKYDQWVREISKLEPGAERERKIKKATKLLTQKDVVVVPLYHYVQNYIVSPKVKLFRLNALGLIRWNELLFEL